jgi:hypothetical protein
VAVRRGDHSGARLKMEQERLEREREKTEEEVIAHFQRWVKNPGMRDWICQAWISPEEREARLREIFGREPKPVKTGEEWPGRQRAKSAKFMVCRRNCRRPPIPTAKSQTQSNQMNNQLPEDRCHAP